MAETKNTFLKGKMNKDLDSRILPNGEYREARNLSISRSESSTVGEFENILGNISISSLTAAPISASAGTEIIGYHIDENSNTAYLFATDYDSPQGVRAPGGTKCFIVSVNLAASNAPTLLVDGTFLNFNKSFRVLGINLIENLLFFTDNLNQPRKINVTTATSDSTYYENEDQISVAKYAPYEPIIVLERVTTTITGASGGSVTITPASMTSIKVGDIITNNNKIATQDITSLVTVIGIPTATTVTLSSSITIPDGTLVDFSKPSMTNQEDIHMSNHSSGAVTVVNPTTIGATYTIGPGNFFFPTSDHFIYNGKNGIPKIGDLVSCTNTPGKIDPDTRVATVVVSNQYGLVGAATSFNENITVTLNKTTTLATGDIISISDNPDYDVNWKGDSKFLEDKFVRFSYRFKFDDNEYSLMAPFSQPMFIPKQYSQFGGGLFSPDDDMTNAYTSTIVAWFENNINNILLRIPMLESTAANVAANFLITDIDILYKESDGLAVKVLETISISDPVPTFSSINYDDTLHGYNTQHFLDYDYSSSKPYKTLPNNQITRVSDRVPIKALAQEVIGNRIVYGNYLDRHTGPSSIAFEATAQNKSVRYDNYTQYPKHQLKQGRSYQVGFVLSDRYGRQSDVILSSYDGVANTPGSTVFHSYNDLAEQTANPILNWLGDCLNVKLDSAIQSTYNASEGTPGIYSDGNTVSSIALQTAGAGHTVGSNIATINGDGINLTVAITSVNGSGGITGIRLNNKGEKYENNNVLTLNQAGATTQATITVAIPEVNPLGWYSYKIVVKQQEQEYYNVYFPGFVNGYPIIENLTNERNKSFFTTLIGDNINKVPRDLSEVGPDDKDFSSSENLTIRVNNPLIDNKGAAYPKYLPWNKQYYPGNINQEVVEISTVRSMEIAGIPFKPGIPAGDYGQTSTTAGPPAITTLAGSIPWGTTGAEASLYNTDANPFVLRGNQSENANNPIGAYVTADASAPSALPASNVFCMVPFLSVAETDPVFSLLNIFWETSLSGNLVELNSLIDSQYAGLTSSNFTTALFPESINTPTQIGNDFNFLDGAGNIVVPTTSPSNIVVNSVTAIDEVGNVSRSPIFNIAPNAGVTAFEIKTVAGEKFFFNETANNFQGGRQYTITANVTYNGLTDNIVFPIVELENVIPSFAVYTQPTVTTGTTTIIASGVFGVVNGSGQAAPTNKQEIVYSLKAGQAAIVTDTFEIDSSTGELTVIPGQVLSDTPGSNSYSIIVEATDVNSIIPSGLTAETTVSFTVGVQVVPSAICNGNVGLVKATCGKSVEYQFLASAIVDNENAPSEWSGLPSAYDVNKTYYNVLKEYNAKSPTPSPLGTTGALSQGVMEIVANFTSTVTGQDAIAKYAIQHRATSSNSWVVATSTTGTITPFTQELTASNGTTNTATYIFDIPGEYRVLTQNIVHESAVCSDGDSEFFITFKDSTYPVAACSGP